MDKKLYEKQIKDGVRNRYEPDNDLPSMTVPDQSMSIKDMIARFASGQSLNVGREVYYEENPDFENVDITLDPNFDLADVTEEQEKLAHRASIIKANADKKAIEDAEQAKKDLRAKIIEEHENEAKKDVKQDVKDGKKDIQDV